MYDIIGEINNLNYNSSKSDILKIVEFDFKKLVVKEKNLNSIELIINCKLKKIHIENCGHVKPIYNELCWNKPYDVITSFLYVYVIALTKFYPEKFRITSSNTIMVSDMPRQRAYSNKYLLNHYKEFKKVNECKQIQRFAALTHSFGNFMPCPNDPFNRIKGMSKDISDFLDIMINRFNSSSITDKRVTKDMMVTWKNWFDEKDYYICKDNFNLINDTSELFKMSDDEYLEFIEKLNNRIIRRGLIIISNINPKIKNICYSLLKEYN